MCDKIDFSTILMKFGNEYFSRITISRLTIAVLLSENIKYIIYNVTKHKIKNRSKLAY